MLEAQSLLLTPHRPTIRHAIGRPESNLSERPIVEVVDPSSGLRVGSVYEPAHTGGYFSWLSQRRLNVYETEDLSLVFSIQRANLFPLSWAVRDANGKRVGTLVYAPDLLLHFRVNHGLAGARRNATFRTEMNGHPEQCRGRFVGGAGNELASVSTSGEGTLVTFAGLLEREPFTKMLVLAAAVVGL